MWWKPIDTVPRNGKPVLVLLPSKRTLMTIYYSRTSIIDYRGIPDDFPTHWKYLEKSDVPEINIFSKKAHKHPTIIIVGVFS